LDLGGVATARVVEQFILFWISLNGAVGGDAFNIAVLRAK